MDYRSHFRCILLWVFCFLVAGFSGCSDDVKSLSAGSVNNGLIIPQPIKRLLSKQITDISNLRANLYVNDGAPQSMTIDEGAGIATISLPLNVGVEYQFVVEFVYLSSFGEVVLANQKIQQTINTNSSAVAFNQNAYDYIDSDDDGLTNIEEVENDTSPFNNDTQAPTIDSQFPSRGVKNIDAEGLNQLTINFSEPIVTDRLSTDNVTLEGEEGVIVGTLGFSGNRTSLFYNLSQSLQNNSVYIVTVTDIPDAANNRVSDTWQFTTLDTVPPSVIDTIPKDSVSGLLLDQEIVVLFSEPVDPLTVNSTSLYISQNGVKLNAVITLNPSNTTATLVPNDLLRFNKDYVINVTQDIRDSINSLSNAVQWKFNTGKQLAAKTDHTCARLVNGSLKCWGNNEFGQLGLGDATNRGDSTGDMGGNLPTVELGGFVVEIVVGAGHSCARLQDGRVKCWGKNDFGQLGLGDINARGDNPNEMGEALPEVDLGEKAVALVAGFNHTCARLESGGIKCWGKNSLGELGVGDTNSRGDNPGEMATLPVVNLNGEVVEFTAGDSYSCARLTDNQVKCWGNNVVGQLGLGDTARRGDSAIEMGAALPFVDLGGTVDAVTAGALHTCAKLTNGEEKCWGFNFYGQLGLGDTESRGDQTSEMGALLLDVPLAASTRALVTGTNHSCALLSDGRLQCWGGNDFGQLGYGDIVIRGDQPNEMGINLPIIEMDDTAEEIEAGQNHTCVVLSDTRIKCWGRNNFGQLGLEDTENRGDGALEMGIRLPEVNL